MNTKGFYSAWKIAITNELKAIGFSQFIILLAKSTAAAASLDPITLNHDFPTNFQTHEPWKCVVGVTQMHTHWPRKQKKRQRVPHIHT